MKPPNEKRCLKALLIAFLVTITTSSAFSQEAGEVAIGVGLGQQYGGIGGNVSIMPTERLGMFAGLGTLFVGAGYNAGFSYFFSSSRSSESFYVTAMYGYNGVIIVDFPDEDFEEIYYGPSFGGGVNLQNKGGNSYWHFSLIIPIRSSEFRDDWDAIKDNPDIETSILLPFTIGIGFHMKF